ncbi:MAG: monovalent cation/H(+) antiporter subunit G [Spirochaetales bacterium]|nr:monovalent cation/H(+) antiporter subunit G [Spirochaetales bacterium]
MSIREILAAIAFLAAVVFGVAGLAGLFRFPDPYSRLQAGSLLGTTSVLSIFIGTLLLSPNGAVAARVVVIMLFFLISSPTGSHIVARFTWNIGTHPWRPKSEEKKKQRKAGTGKDEAAPEENP